MKSNYDLIRFSLLCGILALVMMVGHGYAAVNLDNAFAIWLFDSEDDTVVDHSAQGNDAALTGGNWVEGKFGGGLEMGAGATLMSATANGVSNQAITETLWVKFDDFGAESQFGFINCTGTPSGRFYYFSNWVGAGAAPYDGIHLGVIDGAGNWGRGQTTNPGQFDTDEWYHIAGVADIAGGSLTSYINGELIMTNAIATDEIPGDPNQIWGASGPEGKPVLGTVDEIAFFNVALTQDEIVDIMTMGLANVAAVDSKDKLAVMWSDLKR